jgi:tetratricopeptide (TPR) repeat protein
MRTVRVFISSPSDAIRERDRLARVARRLNLIYAEVVELEIIRWEDDFYSAHDTFQTQIPEAKACDIVIGILKHRLGSPLPSTFPNMPEREPFLGEPYPSGTAYEILSSIANRLFEDSDKPDIYVFRDAEPPVVTLGSDDMERIGREWSRLEDFARRFFFTAEGDFRFAFQTFRSANQFEQQIEALLRKWIETNIYAEHRSVWPVDIKGSPFRALDTFDYAHRDVFFGRDRDTARIVDLLAETAAEAAIEGSPRLPFLLVTGPSGAGKSSLLRAGVVPALTESDVGNTEQWRVAIMTPSGGGTGPFAAMATVLLGKTRDKSAPADAKSDVLLALPELREGPFATAEALGRLLATGDASAALVVADALNRVEKALTAREKFETPPRVRLLLVVDQLDEVFSGEMNDTERAKFVNLLAELARTGSVWIAASLRAGLYENLLGDPGLLALRNAGATYELGSPGSTELADIVRKPAQAADIVYEKDAATGRMLDEILLADFDRPDMLPLLQFTLEALFQRRQVSDGVITLTHAAYRDMNGIAGAVQTAADAAMAKLSEGARQKLPKLLRRLVTMGHAGESETAPLTLNDVPAAELQADAEMLRLAEALTESRILVTGGGSSDTRAFRLAHQRLLTLWQAAETAVRENATFYRVHDELEQAHRRWRRNGAKSAQLIRDPVLLTEAQRLAKAYPDEISDGSLEFLRRSQLRARLGTIILGTSAAVFAVLFAGTIWFYDKASRAEALAVEQKRKAEENLQLAQETLEGVVMHVANGLKNVEGMSVASRRVILTRVASAVEMLQKRGEENPALDETRLQMFDAFGQTYAQGGDVESALISYRQMMALNRSMLDRAQGPRRVDIERNIAVSLDHIGDLLVGQGKREEALKAYQEAHDIRNRLLATNPDDATLKRDLTISIDRIGQSRQALGDIEGAIKAFEEVVASSRAEIKRSPANRQARRDLSISLEHIADIETARGNDARAVPLNEESLAIRKALAAEEPTNTLAAEDLFVALSKKADHARRMPDTATAEATYEEMLVMARRLAALDAEQISRQRSITLALNGLADVAADRGDNAKALARYQEALTITRRLAGVDPTNFDLQNDIAFALNRIGDVSKADGKLAEAIGAFEESLAVSRKLAERDTARAETRRNIAYTLRRIADAKQAGGDLDEAQKRYREALPILESLVAGNPSNPVWQLDRISTIRRIADIDFMAGRIAEARNGYQHSVDIYRPLITGNPEQPEWKRDLSVTINKLGDASLREGDSPAAASAYGEALAMIEDLLKQMPDNVGLKRDLAYCLGKVGSIQQLNGNREGTIALYLRALAVVRELAASAPDNARAQTDLAYSLLAMSDVQTGAERIASLKEAAVVAEKARKAGLLTGPHTALPAIIQAALSRASTEPIVAEPQAE